VIKYFGYLLMVISIVGLVLSGYAWAGLILILAAIGIVWEYK